MRDAINSPAWVILGDWREGGDRRAVDVYCTKSGYILTASDVHGAGVFSAQTGCVDGSGLESAARRLVVAIEQKRASLRRNEVERLRAQLAEAERAELEAASSVERAAHDSERDARASEQPAAE